MFQTKRSLSLNMFTVLHIIRYIY